MIDWFLLAVVFLLLCTLERRERAHAKAVETLATWFLAQQDKARAERAELLNRIQHPHLPDGKRPEPTKRPLWSDEREAEIDRKRGT